MSHIQKVQIAKKCRLEREIAWIRHEFEDIHTLSDIEFYNTEHYARLHLNVNFI